MAVVSPLSLVGFLRGQQVPKLLGASEQGGSCKPFYGLTLELLVLILLCALVEAAVCRDSPGGTLTLYLIMNECQGVNLELLCDSVSSVFT